MLLNGKAEFAAQVAKVATRRQTCLDNDLTNITSNEVQCAAVDTGMSDHFDVLAHCTNLDDRQISDDVIVTQVRYERLELCGIAVVLSAASLLCVQLWSSMVDGWQDDENARWHVLCLSITLLILSVVSCIYLCHRLQPTVRLHSAHPNTMSSVNSRLHLIGSDRPPSYDSVIHYDFTQPPPPSYSAVFNV